MHWFQCLGSWKGHFGRTEPYQRGFYIGGKWAGAVVRLYPDARGVLYLCAVVWREGAERMHYYYPSIRVSI